jgi:hypothetical protein
VVGIVSSYRTGVTSGTGLSGECIAVTANEHFSKDFGALITRQHKQAPPISRVIPVGCGRRQHKTRYSSLSNPKRSDANKFQYVSNRTGLLNLLGTVA